MELATKFLNSFGVGTAEESNEEKKTKSCVEEHCVLSRQFDIAAEAGDVDGIRTLLARLDRVLPDQLETAVRICVEKGRHEEVAQLVQDSLYRCENLATTKLCNTVLEMLAFANPIAFTDTWSAFRDLPVKANEKTTELVLAAHSAHASLAGRIPALMEDMQRQGEIINGSAYNAMIRGALAQNNFDRAIRYGNAMCDAGLGEELDKESIVQMSRLAGRRAGRTETMIGFLEGLGKTPPARAINTLLEGAIQSRDVN